MIFSAFIILKKIEVDMHSMLLSLLNMNPVNDIRYTVLSEQGPFELRYYQKMVCAKVSITGPYEEAIRCGMQSLMDYVGGNNFKVLHIKNHGHPFHVHKVNSWDVGLILPAELIAPKPINRLIKIEEMLPGKVASLRFKGPLNQKTIDSRGEDLMKWLNFKQLIVNGPVRVTHSSAIFPFSFFKMNEVHMDVESL